MPRDSHPHHHFQTHTQPRQLGLTTLHLAAGSATATAKTPLAADAVVEGCAEEADVDGMVGSAEERDAQKKMTCQWKELLAVGDVLRKTLQWTVCLACLHPSPRA